MADKHTSPRADDSSPDDTSASSGASNADVLESAEPASDLQRERDDYHDRWVRTAAEFDNYRRRVERERREQADQAVVSFLLELLSVVDDFDRALAQQGGEGSEAAAYRKGFELIHTKLDGVLRKHGVQPMQVLGTDFDPNLHQAVMHEESPSHREGEVIGELSRGYTMNGRLLRPAMVKVAKA